MLGGVDIGVAVLMLVLVWVALPARWWPIDALGTMLALLFALAGFGLVRGEPWAEKAGLVAGVVALVSGLGLVTALALTASHLAGLYGPVGQGGALLLIVVALLIVPYLVLLPAAQLFVLARARGGRGGEPRSGSPAEA